ncbi:D-alanyl-D-alanine carboxypeptidase family protein [Prosthecomicrobium hirschii]|uniref:D-alanyl-D-alanine carboxypeptidase family protein n=1 Tax=Prosthecodimorpha hirschii TaxID=665126 RepID=UPI0022207097|nr:D-alanyl-D-alanine carboxypeptidase family protein [Prosthecomicrobium hirschii]MCW1839320.1 D-alanyl-D-alanine carboxypeptidase [Prosthecomicrobium hirschii]
MVRHGGKAGFGPARYEPELDRPEAGPASRARSMSRRAVVRLAAAMVGMVALVAAPASVFAQAQTFETKAEQAILIDFESNTVLFEKNADKLFAPASLAKMMTIAVVFDQIKAGKLTLEQDFTISEHAWRTGGAPSRTSSMFAPINSRATVNDLIQGICVQSANDGAIAIAEGIAGTELAFSEMMNKKARDIGMTKSVFRNPTGLPDPDQKITAREYAKLAAYIIANHPDLYKVYSQREFTYNKIRQQNRNPLLNDGIGADGFKTGYIKESGYNIVGSAVQGGQRLIAVMGGMKSEKERAEESRKLLEWGFRSFEQITLYKAGESPGDAKVFGGATATVPLVGEKALTLLVPRGNRDKLRAHVIYRGPVKAPIEKGAQIGKLQVLRGDSVIQEKPLYAAEAVGLGPMHSRAMDAAYESVVRFVRETVGLK